MPDPSSLHADIDAVLPLREHLVVLGPCYLKMVEDVGEIPNSGENVKGTPLKVFPGGKSGNQAVAAGLLGAPVSLVAAGPKARPSGVVDGQLGCGGWK